MKSVCRPEPANEELPFSEILAGTSELPKSGETLSQLFEATVGASHDQISLFRSVRRENSSKPTLINLLFLTSIYRSGF